MRTSLAWMLVLATSLACADDAAWTYVGGAGSFTANHQIRMVSERVDVSLRDKRSHFHAQFLFRNTGPATTVTMAFPEEAHGDHSLKRGVIHDFYSSVDGARVKVRRHKLPYDAKEGSEYRAVWLKEVPFGRHQSRRVVVDYWADNGDIGDRVSNKYILMTGATWKGKIHDCVVNIDWSGFREQSDPEILKEGVDNVDEALAGPSKSRSATLHYRDFKPDFDILMNWWNDGCNILLNGEFVGSSGMTSNQEPYIFLPDSDPRVAIRFIPELFGEEIESEGSDQVPEVGTPFDVGDHHVRVLSEHQVEIDGKIQRLPRLAPSEQGRKCIYLRDLIRLLHGRTTYSASLRRLIIRV